MERIISEQDRIRRAEEIAGRRRGTISARDINVEHTKKKMPMLTKVFIQTVASICIFGLAYFLTQNNYPFMDSVRSVLSADINIGQIYNELNNSFKSVSNWYNGLVGGIGENKQDDANEADNTNAQENNIENTNEIEGVNNVGDEANGTDGANNGEDEANGTNTSETENVNNEETNSSDAGGIGGSDENITLSQNEQDIAYIKENASIIVPVYGTVTSGYGPRTPTDIISANHAGLDIGANEGTEIIAAMEGTVELVSSYGDYGNHVKITNGEISTMYAHCKDIYVNQGDYISQGQVIATVGNTGRTTGPHLHFEIARSGRTVDPQAIIQI